MSIDKKTLLNGMILKPTPEEEALLNGNKGDKLVDFYRDLQNREDITPQHFESFKSISGEFQNSIDWQKAIYTPAPHFEGGRLRSNSRYFARYTGTATEALRNRTFLSMNFLNITVCEEGFHAVTLSAPVKWDMPHIQKRMQNRGMPIMREKDPIFHHHNAVALAMLHIIEQIEDEHPRPYHPFILPHKQGILLGHTVPDALGHKNRIALNIPVKGKLVPTKRYDWIPNMMMTVRTYIGPEQMSSSQENLRRLLLPFYAGSKAKSLTFELDAIDDTAGPSGYKYFPSFINYADTFLKLEEIMHSDAWKLGVRMPTHLTATLLKPSP